MSQKGDKVNVFVTVVRPLGKACEIWAQTNTEACQEIETLMTVASPDLESRSMLSLDKVSVGDVFLAMFHEDMKWYRASVKDIDKTNGTVKVFFIDYGNEESIKVTDLAMGEGKHFEIPPQASRFLLGEIQAKNNHKWTDVEIAGLNEQLVYGEFAGVVLNENTVGNPRVVRLFTDTKCSESLVTSIIAGGFGTRANIGMENSLKQTILKPKDNYHVYVVFYESPLNFWIQLTESENVLNQLQETICSEVTDQTPGVSHVTIGTVCIAKFCDGEMETFYRAVVTEVHPDGNCTVLYVDYGNSEKVSFKKLKAIPSVLQKQLQETPSQAIQCCLQGTLIDADQFQKMLENEHIYAKVVSVGDSGFHVVQLYEGQSTQPQATPCSEPPSRQSKPSAISNNNTTSQSSYHPLQFNISKQVDLCISHVEPSGKFYCQLLENGPTLNNLMYTLEERYQARGIELDTSTPGTPCVTRSIVDNCVYRSKIVATENHNITVQHIDFGHSEVVPRENVLVIDKDFMVVQSQSIYCSLSDSESHSATAVANLLKKYESQTALVGAIMLKYGQLYEMELVDTSSISDVYLAKELQKNESLKCSVKEQAYKKINLNEGQWIDVVVHYLIDPANLYCQFVSSQKEFKVMMGQIERHCSSGNATHLTQLEKDVPCLAKCSGDEIWYRSIIVGVHPEGIFDVYFVDYGNHDSVSQDRLRVIPIELMILPEQCFRGVLDGIVGSPGSWTSQDIKLLFEMTSENNHHTLVTKHEAHDDLYIIQIFTSIGGCINKEFGKRVEKLSPAFISKGPPPHLCKSQSVQTAVRSKSGPTSQSENGQGWAQWQQPQHAPCQQIKPLEVQPGYKNIIIETIVNPGEFYCRLTENSEALFDFMDEMNAEYLNLGPDDLRLSNLKPGMVCCAPFNNAWYRAMILSVSNTAAGVQYVDFGNTEMVLITDIKQLKPEHTKMPAQALKCSIAGVAPIGESWSEDSGTVFESIMGESKMVGAFTECGNDGIYLIEVVQSIAGGQILFHEELVKQGIATQLPQKPEIDHVLLHGNRHQPKPNSLSTTGSLQVSHKYSKPVIAESQTVDVNVVHVETPTEFWVHLTQNCTTLQDLMNNLQLFYSSVGADSCRIQSVNPDMACIARFSEDGMWYRAEIVQELRGELLVRYVDYGNYEKRSLSDIWEIKEEFLKLPAQAIQCSLHNIVAPPTGWASTTRDTFEDLVLDKNLLAEVISVLSSPQVLAVKLLETKEKAQVNIADQLIQLKLAMCATVTKPISRQNIVSSGRTNETQQANLSHAATKTPPKSASVKKDMPPQDIAIGDHIIVNIVWVNSPTSFWCQRLGSQMVIQELVGALSEQYEGLRMKEAEIRSPQIGQLCVALYNTDGNWYRSRVLRTQNREAEVLYVDFGNIDRIPWSKLKEIEPKFLDIPQMALHCTLSGMEVFNGEYDQAVKKYFSEVMAQDVSLSVKALPEKSGDAHVVSITDKEGNDLAKRIIQIGTKSHSVPQVQPQNMATQGSKMHSEARHEQKSVSQQSSDVALSVVKIPESNSELTVSYVETVDCFYCQLTNNIAELDSFMADLDAHYASGMASPLAPDQVKVGMSCAAQFSEDNYWYRAKVKSVISPKEVEVAFVDYANSEVTNIKNVCPLMPKFADYPVQAFQCALSGFSSVSSSDSLSHFRQLVEGKELLVKFIHKGKKLEVELTDKATNTNINSAMISKFSCLEKKTVTVENYPPSQQPTGTEEVCIRHVESPERFWIQLKSQEAEIQTFDDSMFERYNTLRQDEEKLGNATLNGPCVARFSEDGAWYRGIIERKEGNIATVRFIDYGNTECLSIDDLKNIAPDLLVIPPFAIHCKLEGITKPSTGWTDEQREVLTNIDVSLMATFTPEAFPVTVKLKADGVDIAEQIGEMVLKPTLITIGTKFLAVQVPSAQATVQVTHVEDGFVYAMLEEKDDQLQELSNKLQDLYETEDGLSLNVIHPGDACIAQFSEDQAWYRAVIESVDGELVKVRFIDFGNSDLAPRNSLKGVRSELLQEPPFVIKCQLDGVVRPASGFPKGFTEMLENQLAGTEVVVTFVGTEEPYTLVLAVDGNKTAQLIHEIFPQVAVKLPCPVDVPKFPKQSVANRKQHPQTMYASHIEDPHCIFLQFDSDSDILQNITEILDEIYGCMDDSQMQPSSVEVGAACVAKFSEDGTWYRSEIEAADPEITVQFIDFGNEETTTSKLLKELTPNLLNQSALGFRCHLLGVVMPPSGWPDGVTEELESLIMDRKLQTMFHNDESPFVVQLLVDGDDINACVQQYINTATNGTCKESMSQSTSDVQDLSEESDLSSKEQPNSEVVKLNEGPESEDFRSEFPELNEQVSLEQVTMRSSDVTEVLEFEEDVVECSEESEPIAIIEVSLESEDASEVCSNILADATEEPEGPSEFQDAACSVEKSAPEVTSKSVVEEGSICDGSSNASGEFTDANEENGITDKSQEASAFLEVCHGELSANKSFESEADGLVPTVELHIANKAVAMTSDRLGSEKRMGTTSKEVTAVTSDEEAEFQEAVNELQTSPTKMLSAEGLVSELSSEASEEFTDAMEKIEDNLALQPGDRVEVTVLHVKSPSRFWCMLRKAEDACENMMAAVAECCESGSAPAALTEGDSYGARHTDSEWYRVSVTAVGDEQVGAFFIDIGNTEQVYKSDLRPLPHVLKKTHGFALPCLLHGIKPSETVWSEKAIIYFDEISNGKRLLAEIIEFDSDQEVYIVKLLDMGISVAQKLIEKSLATTGDALAYEVDAINIELPDCEVRSPEQSEEYTYRDLDQAKSTLFFAEDEDTVEFDISMLPKSSLKDGERAEVFISHVQSFGSIFVHLKRQQSVLQELMNEMQGAYDTTSLNTDEFKATIKSGLICAACSTKDHNWYRAHVLDVVESDDIILVQFIDYGTTEAVEVNKLHPLKPKFQMQPQQTINCRVFHSDDLGTKVFDSFVIEVQEKVLLAEVQEVLDDIPSIKLLDMGTCVLSKLTSENRHNTALKEIDVLKCEAPDSQEQLTHLFEEIALSETGESNSESLLDSSQRDVQGAEQKLGVNLENKSPELYKNEEAVVEQTISALVNLKIVDTAEPEINIKDIDTEEQKPTFSAPSTEVAADACAMPVRIESNDIQLGEEHMASTSVEHAMENRMSTLVDDVKTTLETETNEGNESVQVKDSIAVAEDTAKIGLTKDHCTEQADNTVFEEMSQHGGECASKMANDNQSDALNDSIAAAEDTANIGLTEDLCTEQADNIVLEEMSQQDECASKMADGNQSDAVNDSIAVAEDTANIGLTEDHCTEQADITVLEEMSQQDECASKMADDNQSGSPVCRATEELQVRYPCFSVDEELNVIASVITSPDNFWCQLVQPSTNKLPLLSDLIQDYCSATTDSLIHDPYVGKPCLAQCSRDGNWYRGAMQEVNNESVDVRYVDYGSSESTKLCNLRISISDFLELDAQAFKCCLAGIVSNDAGQWDETSCARFEELLSDKDLTLTIVAKKPSTINGSEELTVILRDNDSSIADVLLGGGYAQAEICGEDLMEPVQNNVFTCSTLEPKSVWDVKFCHGVSPDNFSLQCRKDADKLEMLMSTLSETHPAAEVIVGEAVLVDSKRATVLEVTEEQCRVAFVDEGSEGTTLLTGVRHLPVKGTVLPPQAICCRLAGIDPESYSQEALHMFEGFKGKDALSALVVAVENNTHLVYLYDLADESGISVNTQLVSHGFVWPLPDQELLDLDESVLSTQGDLETSFLEYNRDRRQSLGELGEESVEDTEDEEEVMRFEMPQLAAGDVVELTCFSAKDPSNLMCRLASYRDQAAALAEQLNQLDIQGDGETVRPARLRSGDACLAYSVAEGAWCRARVLAKEPDDEVAVHFVDSGDGATVSPGRLRRIPRAAMTLPAQAVTCSVTAEQPAEQPAQRQWTEAAVTALRKNCENKTISATIQSVEADCRLVISIQPSDGQNVDDLVTGDGDVKDEQDSEVNTDAGALAEKAEVLKNNDDVTKDTKDGVLPTVAFAARGGTKKQKKKKKRSK